MDSLRVCKDCSIAKPFAQFNRAGRFLKAHCKPCAKIRLDAYRNAPKRTTEVKQCRRCNAVKTSSEFFNDRSTPDGLRPHCKPCTKEINTAQHAKPKVLVVDKLCRDCGIAKPVSDFQTNNSIRDGLHSYCRDCNGIRVAAHNSTYHVERINRVRNRSKRVIHATVRGPDVELFNRADQWFEKQRKRLDCALGVSHARDHIVPLIHPLVCGLHTPANWQILTAEENANKGNHFVPA